MRVNSDFGNQNKIIRVRQSVYVGRDRIGDIAQRGDEYEAHDRRGHIIGVFESALAAADAVSAADTISSRDSRHRGESGSPATAVKPGEQ